MITESNVCSQLYRSTVIACRYCSYICQRAQLCQIGKKYMLAINDKWLTPLSNLKGSYLPKLDLSSSSLVKIQKIKTLGRLVF